MTNMGTNPMDLAWHVAAGKFSESVCEALRLGFSAFINAGGDVPLERCLRLPVSGKRFRLMQRDLWLAEVVESSEGKTPWAKCVAASAALDAFLLRGQWCAWRNMPDPPAGTSNLRVALFYTAKFNDGEGLSTKQVERRIGHIFNKSVHASGASSISR